MPWVPMFALPNTTVRDPIEIAHIALVSADDVRIQELAQEHTNFASFLTRFTTEFGRTTTPSVLMCHTNAPSTYRSVEALAGFRDAVMISTIPQSWRSLSATRTTITSNIQTGSHSTRG